MSSCRSPYKGLNPYSEEDAKIFFGREKFRDIVISNLIVSRLTILYGESGVGKSSLLRAGVAATLKGNTEEQPSKNIEKYRQPRFLVIVFPSIESDSSVNKNSRSWKDEPLSQLKEQIEEDIQKVYPYIKSPDPDLSLVKTLEIWLERLKYEYGEIFIILDQFEEYFHYHPPKAMKEGTFDYQLSLAVKCRELPVHFLISIRKDSLALLDRYKGRLLNLLSNRLELEHLNRDSAKEAIVNPIVKYFNTQKTTEKKIDFTIQDNFVDEILDDLVSEEERNNPNLSKQKPHIKAPYLQLVMDSIWHAEMTQSLRCLQIDTFNSLGRSKGIAEQHVASKLRSPPLSLRELDIAASVFHYLVTPSGSKLAISASDLADWARADWAKEKPLNHNDNIRNSQFNNIPIIWLLLQEIDYMAGILFLRESLNTNELSIFLNKLTESEFRILRTVGKSPNVCYEIFHDVLAMPILTWQSQKIKERIEKRAKQQAESIEVEATKKSEQKIQQANQEAKQTIQKTVIVSFSIAVILAMLAILIAMHIVRISGGISEVILLRQEISKLSQGNNKSNESNTRNRINDLNTSYLQKFVHTGNRLKNSRLLWQIIGQGSYYSTQKSRLMRTYLIPDQKLPVEKKINQNYMQTFWSISFSPDGKKLAAGSEDGKLRLWNLQEQPIQKPVIFPNSGETWISSASFSPDGKKIAAGSKDGKLRLWNLEQPIQEREPVIFPNSGETAIFSISFSSDGKKLATGSEDGKLRLWNLEQPIQEQEPKIFLYSGETAILSVSFSPDDKQLAAGLADATFHLWDIKDKPIRKPKIETNPNESFLETLGFNFSQNRKYFAVVFDDSLSGQTTDKAKQQRIDLWDLQSKQRVYSYPQNNEITRISLSPDGKQLATASKDGSITLWPIYTFDELLEEIARDLNIKK